MGWISAEQLRRHCAKYGRSSYGDYLASLPDPAAVAPSVDVALTDPAP